MQDRKVSDRKVSAHCWKQASRKREVSFGVASGQSPPNFSPPQPTSLFITPSHLLDTFIIDFLQSNKKFLKQIRKAVNIICEFLKNNCFKDSSTKVQKVVKVSAGLLPVPALGSQGDKGEGRQHLTFSFLPREDPLPKARL